MKFSKEEKKLLLEIIGDYQLNMLIKFCKKHPEKEYLKLDMKYLGLEKLKVKIKNM